MTSGGIRRTRADGAGIDRRAFGERSRAGRDGHRGCRVRFPHRPRPVSRICRPALPGGEVRAGGCRLRGDNGTVPVPFWIYTDHVIITMGTLNGHAAMPLTVDTDGTAPFLTSQPVVRSTGIKVVKAVQARRTLAGRVGYDLINVNEIALGRFTRRNVSGLSNSGQGFPYPFTNGGTVTAYFLLGTAFTIDTQHMRLYADQISPWSPPAPAA